jgi:hypothetical protein
LVIHQWRMKGRGHIVADYSESNDKAFTHRRLDKRFY